MKSTYEKRILTTVVVVAVALAGNAIVLPGIPAELLDAAGGWVSIFPPHRLRVLSFGLLPYLSAAGLWLLLSGVIGPLQRLREGTAAERAAFDRGIVWLALIIGLSLALGQWASIQALMAVHGVEGAAPSPLLMVPTVLAGLALLIGMALFTTRAGVGNGVAWIALASPYLASLPESVSDELVRLQASSVGYFRLPIAVAVLVGLVVVCCFYVRSREDLALEPAKGRKPSTPVSAPPIPLRFDLTGVTPAVVASALLSVPRVLMGMFPSLPPWLDPAPAVYWVLFAVLTILLSYVIAGIGFDTRRVGPMLERFGYRIAGAQDQPTEEYLDRLIERRILPSAAALIGIVVVPGLVLEALTGISLVRAGITGPLVLILCAIVLDTVRQARGMKVCEGQAAADEGAGENSDEEQGEGDIGSGRVPASEADADAPVASWPEGWTDVFESDVEFEARLALSALEAHGIRGVVLANRVIPFTGTFAFWEWTAPTYPFLVIHRRLGGGRVVLRVPQRDVERAQEVVAGFRT